MLDLERSTRVEGSSLLAAIDAVRRDFLSREAYEEDQNGFRHVNSVRSITAEVFDGLSRREQVAVIEDLLFIQQDVEFVRDESAIFCASACPGDYITDLVCEVIWQALVREPQVRVEDEIRVALSSAAQPLDP